ncbi:MAG: ATP-binding cassette domain-containing protein, partial [Acidimicrobiales bacterium]
MSLLGRNREAAEADGPLLSCRRLEVAYGRTQVLFGVDLEIGAGEIVAVLGTNGAGKSTLLRAISGLTAPTAGQVVFAGRDVTGAAPARMARLGVSHMPGGRGVFPDLTVAENLRMAAWGHGRDRQAARSAVDQTLELFPALPSRLRDQAGLLSGGQQQMLALAQAFIPGPRLLLIDELSLGLAPIVVTELLKIVRRMRDQGVAVVLVEQSADLALQVADRATFLEKGESRFSGTAAELKERDDLVRSVFLAGARDAAVAEPPGGDTSVVDRTFRQFTFSGPVRDGDHPAERPSLSARRLRKSFGGLRAVDDVDLDVAPGEILGLMGPNGAGKTTVLDILSGFVTPDAGTVYLGSANLTGTSADSRARRGLGRSFQDARLFSGLTVEETVALSCERWVTSREPLAAALRLPASLISEAEVGQRTERILRLLGLGLFRHRFATELSTGSRRLVEFGCLLAAEPDVLLLDEPSAGLARAEAEALAPVLRRIRDATGAAVVVVEHDLGLLRSTCDRLIALDTGRELTQGTPDEVLSHPAVVAAYLG